ncbi:ribosome maturation factor rimP [Striga asiatica]|uniref:Ribosome maturation factor rimP n=1 Tax=Striga asiatica TaxID=4170 RepID=A0A5A7PH31_STRAF|nr:ribosome maturation factor rimP [Striga asiatica]
MRNSIAGRVYHCAHRGLRKFGLPSALYSRHIHEIPIPAFPKPGSYLVFDSFRKYPQHGLCFPSITLLRRLHVSCPTEQACKDSVDGELCALCFVEIFLRTTCLIICLIDGFCENLSVKLVLLGFSCVRKSSDESNGEVEPIDTWEEEDEAEPEIGDGGDGGGIVLHNCPWGQRALSIALELLQDFGEDMKIYAFKTSPRGYIYVRLDKIPNEYGCPSMEEIESFSREYKKKLDEVGARGEIPDDLALEVSSPGADRLLKVPDDLLRFKDLPMLVSYKDNPNTKCQEKNGVFFLDSIETESRCCIWKLADVRENLDPSAKGRPLSLKVVIWTASVYDWNYDLGYEASLVRIFCQQDF